MTKFFEKNKISLTIILGAIIIGLFVYISRQKGESLPRLETIKPTSTPALSQESKSSSSPSTVASPISSVDDNFAIRLALIAKTKITDENLEFSISQNTGEFAKGTVKNEQDIGGGYFLAAKVNGSWVIVYDGQSNPTCLQLASYNFPKDIVPECLDSGGKIVKR